MLEKIIMFVCFFMCAVPFFIIAKFNKESITPIAFWSGSEKKLKEELKDIQGYNKEMAGLYKICAMAFLAAGVASFIHPFIGLVILGLVCTIGFYFVYKKYKVILGKYSK